MMDVIKVSKLTKAISVEGWSYCFWNNPKLSVICGNCKGPFKTREYLLMRDRGDEIAVFVLTIITTI